MNTLYYGDNLDVMRRRRKDECVDLVYLDLPFNSEANYKVLFQEQKGRGTSIVASLYVYLGLSCASLTNGGMRLCLS